MIRSLEQLPLDGRRVLMRVDFNVPLTKQRTVSDDTRIQAALPSIRYVLEKGGRLILCSHLGRPDGKPDPKYSLEPVAQRLVEILAGPEVIAAHECVGDGVLKASNELHQGQVLLLENVRFHPEEEANDEGFSRQLAALADVYVNDAFGTAHRAHASTTGVAKFVKEKGAGFLMKKEVDFLSRLLHKPGRPYVAILGGAKVSDKIKVIDALLTKVDALCIGGAMAYTFLAAQGISVGKSRVEKDHVSTARALLERAGKLNIPIVLPQDHVAASDLEGKDAREIATKEIPAELMGLDIGPKTIAAFTLRIAGASTVFWNGPVGLFETPAFAKGTREVAKAMAANTSGLTVVGGGDSAAAIVQMGYADRVSHVSTGGGASLELIEGRTLPGVAALEE